MQAKDIMTTDIKLVYPETPVENIAAMLLDSRISAVPVTRPGGTVVGMVSEGDLVRRVENDTMFNDSWWLSLFTTAKDRVVDFKKFHGRTAADVMTKDVITISGEMPVDDIARTLEKHQIKRVPVTSNGKIIGIVSRADLIGNLANGVPTSDKAKISREEMAARVRAVHDVIASCSAHPHMVNAHVDGENVDLFGIIESRQDTANLVSEILQLPGIISVNVDMLRESSNRESIVRG